MIVKLQHRKKKKKKEQHIKKKKFGPVSLGGEEIQKKNS